ncbi:hypothetical protein [Actinokineospora sp.]|uniref:hypothetical protein n=1 Tax=Actinokineospora sp. TaxID=1872133 RepID=UPI0040381A0A
MFRRLAVCLSFATVLACVAAPAASAETRAEPKSVCAALTVELQAQLDSIKAEVGAELPNGETVADVQVNLKSLTVSLEAHGCVPAVPPAAGTEITTCLELTAKLHAHVHASVALQVSASPDYIKIGAEVDGAIEVVGSLIADKCLPESESTEEPEPAEEPAPA